jgi:hypothetical protein
VRCWYSFNNPIWDFDQTLIFAHQIKPLWVRLNKLNLFFKPIWLTNIICIHSKPIHLSSALTLYLMLFPAQHFGLMESLKDLPMIFAIFGHIDLVPHQ